MRDYQTLVVGVWNSPDFSVCRERHVNSGGCESPNEQPISVLPSTPAGNRGTMKRIRSLMLGPLSPPITGQSIANEMLLNNVPNATFVVRQINTNTVIGFENFETQGTPVAHKLLRALRPFLTSVIAILSWKPAVLYVTVGQTFLGFVRFAVPMLICRALSIPYVIHLHGGAWRFIYEQQTRIRRLLLDSLVRHSARIIVLGNSLKSTFPENLVPERKMAVCENGIDPSVVPSQREISAKLCTEPIGVIRVLFLSNLMEKKGIMDLIDAMLLLQRDGRKVELSVAGAIEPKMKKPFEAARTRYGFIHYYGVVSGEQKKTLLLQNDVFCLPTYFYEGQPISILEAMICGNAIVTTDYGGIRDIFSAPQNGCFCRARQPESIASAIEQVWDACRLIGRTNHERTMNYNLAQYFSARVFEVLSKAARRC